VVFLRKVQKKLWSCTKLCVGIKNLGLDFLAHSKYGAHQLSLHVHLPPNPTLIPHINMPRSVQPGGVSRQMRVRYTACRKLGLLTAAERLQREEGMTIRRAAEELLMAHSLIVKRGKQRRARGGLIPSLP
jgi:hypothetical protein